ncbi:hypothetical protein HMPREF1988_02027, partial [Porphyromonas gingivalis F0185]
MLLGSCKTKADFNCTIQELKRNLAICLEKLCWNFNCTIQEL